MQQPAHVNPFRFEHTFAERLPNFSVSCAPTIVPNPSLLELNHSLAKELRLKSGEWTSDLAARIFSGNQLPPDAQPIAQAYAGHQFGHFVPQLGDGRALLLGEVIDHEGRRRDIALKGSGPTAFSRGGDGKAAVGPVLREYLIGEAMHALGIPTTRALAAVRTGDSVSRGGPLPGAIITRVAASHFRVGTFEYYAARRRYDQVRALADYVIERHDPGLSSEPDRYLRLLEAVAERQANLVAQWMLVGFIHGVMNTDNTSISGETIDYGPCAFMDSYSPRTVFSSIDTMGRYAYGNQPMIACWNLARFAETLLPLIDETAPDRAAEVATEVVHGFMPLYQVQWLGRARAKLGLTIPADDETDQKLVGDWLELLEQNAVDFTLGWRRLADAAEGNSDALEVLFPSADVVRPWLAQWRLRLAAESSATANAMRAFSPIYIPRNHLVEEALVAASEHADLTLFERLLEVLAEPFQERPGLERYAQPAPREFTACFKTFCGT